MKSTLIITALIFLIMNTYAQKQSFDLVKYSMPKGWDKTVTENGVQLSTKDDGKGNYAATVIVRLVASNATANENFKNSWQSLVLGTVKVNGEPSMSDMAIEKGWEVITGQANYTDGSTKGIITLITATGNGKMANVVIMTNTSKYQEEVLAFVNSLELSETATAQNNSTTESSNANQNSLLGIWGQYENEANTAGYNWREYYFYDNGSYEFLQKNISYLYQNNIVFSYEKGSYTLSGNKLTITPQSGTVESWSKAGSDKAGKLLKTEKRPLETITYNISFQYFSGIQKTNLVLQSTKHTLRDGAFTTNSNFKNSWLYDRPYNANKPQIELPAGSKIKLVGKPTAASTSSSTNATTASVKSVVTGKI
jgi:hypothetical protein